MDPGNSIENVSLISTVKYLEVIPRNLSKEADKSLSTTCGFEQDTWPLCKCAVWQSLLVFTITL